MKFLFYHPNPKENCLTKFFSFKLDDIIDYIEFFFFQMNEHNLLCNQHNQL